MIWDYMVDETDPNKKHEQHAEAWRKFKQYATEEEAQEYRDTIAERMRQSRARTAGAGPEAAEERRDRQRKYYNKYMSLHRAERKKYHREYMRKHWRKYRKKE